MISNCKILLIKLFYDVFPLVEFMSEKLLEIPFLSSYVLVIDNSNNINDDNAYNDNISNNISINLRTTTCQKFFYLLII